jgi:hypothetical protein
VNAVKIMYVGIGTYIILGVFLWGFWVISYTFIGSRS